MIKKIVFLGDSITDAGHLWTSDEFPLGEGYVSFSLPALPRLIQRLKS